MILLCFALYSFTEIQGRVTSITTILLRTGREKAIISRRAL